MYEEGLHRHYNRPGYWVDEPAPAPTEHFRSGEHAEGLTTF
jgi:hypothetical protein